MPERGAAGRAQHDGAGREPSVAEAPRWPLMLIVALALILVASLWGAVLFKVAAEERAELITIERRTTNLARVFEEHTVRTLASVDQALLFVKFQYEKVGEALAMVVHNEGFRAQPVGVGGVRAVGVGPQNQRLQLVPEVAKVPSGNREICG